MTNKVFTITVGSASKAELSALLGYFMSEGYAVAKGEEDAEPDGDETYIILNRGPGSRYIDGPGINTSSNSTIDDSESVDHDSFRSTIEDSEV